MSTRPPAPRPRGRGAQAEGGRRHTTLGIQETRSRGGRRRNVPAPSAVGGDKGQRYIFPPARAGRGGSMPHRPALPHSQANATRRPSPTSEGTTPDGGLRGRGSPPDGGHASTTTTAAANPRQPEGGEGGGCPEGEPAPRTAPAQAGKLFALRRPDRITPAPHKAGQQGREASAPRTAAARGAGKGRRRPQAAEPTGGRGRGRSHPAEGREKRSTPAPLAAPADDDGNPAPNNPGRQTTRGAGHGRKAAAAGDAKAGGVRGELPPRPPPRSLDDVRRYRCRIYYATAEGTRLVTSALPNLLP